MSTYSIQGQVHALQPVERHRAGAWKGPELGLILCVTVLKFLVIVGLTLCIFICTEAVSFSFWTRSWTLLVPSLQSGMVR